MVLSSVGARGHCRRPGSWKVMGGVVMGPPHSSEPPTLIHASWDGCWASRVPSWASTRVSTFAGQMAPDGESERRGGRSPSSRNVCDCGANDVGLAASGQLQAGNHQHDGRAKDPPIRPHRASLDTFPADRSGPSSVGRPHPRVWLTGPYDQGCPGRGPVENARHRSRRGRGIPAGRHGSDRRRSSRPPWMSWPVTSERAEPGWPPIPRTNRSPTFCSTSSIGSRTSSR